MNRILICLLSVLFVLAAFQPSQAYPGSGARFEASSEGAVAVESVSTREVIDKWLIGWSTAQANSVQEMCEQESGCDPSQYAPEARPKTSFGWDGAENINQTGDWARGPRANA